MNVSRSMGCQADDSFQVKSISIESLTEVNCCSFSRAIPATLPAGNTQFRYRLDAALSIFGASLFTIRFLIKFRKASPRFIHKHLTGELFQRNCARMTELKW